MSSPLRTLRLSGGPDRVASLLSGLHDSPGTRECPLICSPFLPGYFLQPLSSTSGGHVLFSTVSPSIVALAPDLLNRKTGLEGAAVVLISSFGESSVQPAWGPLGPVRSSSSPCELESDLPLELPSTLVLPPCRWPVPRIMLFVQHGAALCALLYPKRYE